MKLQDVVVHSVVVSVLATEEDIFADRLPCDHIVSMEGVLDKNFTTNYDVEVLRPLAVPIKLLIPVEEDQVATLNKHFKIKESILLKKWLKDFKSR